jgi:TPR repeat protein
MGQLYMEGTGVPADSALARHYTLEAAERGVAGAQYNAGLLTLRAAGIKPDLIEAYKWFALALRAQYPGADENLKRIAYGMPPAELAKAEALVAAFRPAP